MIRLFPALTISREDGSIKIGGVDNVIAKGTAKSLALGMFEALYKSTINHKDGYEWVMFQDASFGGLPCSFSLCFHLGSLDVMTFGVSVSGAELDAGWPTRATSEREIAFIRGQLTKQLNADFPSGTQVFPWGVVSSVFDEKGCQASSSLRYSD